MKNGLVEKLVRQFVNGLESLIADESQDGNGVDRAISLGRVWEQISNHFYENEFMDYSTYPVDLYWDRGVLYLIMVREGRLYRTQVTIEDEQVMLGEIQEVMETFIPVTSGGEERTIARAFRQADGRVRVVVTAATAVINRDGQIDSTVLFDDFVDRIKTTGVYPTVNFHHYREIRLGECDFAARSEFCYVLSYVFDDTDIGRAAGQGYLDDPEYWGHSIEFLSFETESVIVGDVEVTAHVRGVNTGLAILHEQKASSLFTNRGIAQKSKLEERMNQADFEDLEKLAGTDVATATLESVSRTNQEIKEKGMVTRSTSNTETQVELLELDTEEEETAVDDDQDVTTIEAEVEVVEEETVIEIDDALVDAIAARLEARMNEQDVNPVTDQIVERLNQVVERLNTLSPLVERVNRLERDEVQRQQAVAADSPRQQPRITRVSYRPSQPDNDPQAAYQRAKQPTQVNRLGGLDPEEVDSIAQDTLDSLPPLVGGRR